jgi:hypothetical protein
MYARPFREYFIDTSPQLVKLHLALKGMRSDEIITIHEQSHATLVKFSTEGLQILPAMVESLDMLHHSCKRPTSKGAVWITG